MRISDWSSDVCSSDLAAGADDVADLRLVDSDRLDARRIRRQFAARLAERLVHLAQDVRAAFLGLLQRRLEDFLGDAGDLDVHLHRGDAFVRRSEERLVGKGCVRKCRYRWWAYH